MMQGYAGPVQQGDMVVRANEVSPGITALLSKQNRKGAQGIYELPTAKPANPDYYNMALGNVQNQIRSAAQTVNAMAPQGERLAYINPQEEGILRLLGGSGQPEPVTGIPSFAPPGQGSTGTNPGFKGSYSKSPKKNSGATGPANTQFQQNAAGLAAAIKEATGPAYADQAKGAVTSFIGSAGSKDGKYDPVKAAQALVNISKSGTPEQQALAKQENKALLNALKYSLGSYDYGGKNLFGGFSLGDETKNILRAAQTYGQLPRDKNLAEKAVDLFSKFSFLGNLLGGGKKLEDMSIEELTAFYNRQDEMRRQDETRRSRGDRGDSKPSPAQEEAAEETTDEEELPYFNWYRKFKLPMTYEDIIKRAYQGSTGPLLETYKEAIDKAKK